MSKQKSIVIAASGAVLIVCIGLIFFANKSKSLSRQLHETSKKLEEMHPGYQKLSQSEAALRSVNDQLLKENEAVKLDRENLVAQVKTLIPERNRAIELAASAEKLNRDLAVIVQEKNQLQEADLALKDENNRLKAAQKDLIAKWDTLKSTCDKAEATVKIRELNRKAGDLQKEKAAIQNNAKRQETELDSLRKQKAKLDLDNAALKLQLKDTQTKLTEAVNKNKRMWEEVQNTPKKVTELARQNKVLLAETSQMHYNLGIFYSKNKQYDRALIEFQKVVEIDPNNAYAHFNLGYIYAEYLVNRQKASKHFRYYLGLAKSDDRDIDWVKKYLLTWEAYDGKQRVQ